jgi:hypothetical protein
VFGCVTLFPPDLDATPASASSVAPAADRTTIADLVGASSRRRAAPPSARLQLDPRAQDALTTAGIAASHPCVAP